MEQTRFWRRMANGISTIWGKQAMCGDAHVSPPSLLTELASDDCRHELASRLVQDPQLSNITVVGLDPGAMGSDLHRRGSFVMSHFLKILAPVISLQARFKPNGEFRPLWKSAEDAVRLAFETEAPTGELLYLNGTDELETGREARDSAKRGALWSYGLKATGIQQDDTVLNGWQ